MNDYFVLNGRKYVPQKADNLYRVRCDGEIGYTRTWVQDSGNELSCLPAVFPMRAKNETTGNISDTSGEVRTHLPEQWFDYYAWLNLNTARGFIYLCKPDSGLFNGGIEKGLEQLLMAGNTVRVLEIVNSKGVMWGRIDTFNVNDTPPADDKDVRIQKFTVIKRDGFTLVNPPPGVVRWALVSHVPVWYKMNWLQRV